MNEFRCIDESWVLTFEGDPGLRRKKVKKRKQGETGEKGRRERGEEGGKEEKHGCHRPSTMDLRNRINVGVDDYRYRSVDNVVDDS